MLIGQIHQEFKILADKSDSLNSANFTPEERDTFLNMAQEEIVKVRTAGDNLSSKTGFEETQKRVDDLKNLTVNGNIDDFTNNANNKPNGIFAPLPNGVTVQGSLGVILPKYRHIINEEVTIDYTNCNNVSVKERVKVVYISHNRYNEAIRNPYDQPDKNSVFRLSYGKVTFTTPILNPIGTVETVELITDSTSTITNYHLRYIKEPVQMRLGTEYAVPTTDVECELSDHLHRELIQTAVRIALEDIESQRYKTKLQEQQISQTN